MRHAAIILFSTLLTLSACGKAPQPVEQDTAKTAAAAAVAPAQPVKPASRLPAQTPVLFRDVQIFDGSSSTLSGPMNVLVEAGKIARIEATPIEAPAGAVVFEGKGRTLMPGLIDNHVHLTMSSWSQAEALADGMTSAQLEVRAAQEAEAMLLRGFTTARDMGGPIFSLKAGIDKGTYVGPRV